MSLPVDRPTMPLHSDHQRSTRDRRLMGEQGFDAVIVAKPSSVLLLSGYWPVIGATLAIATTRRTVLLTPENEVPEVQCCSADAVYGYEMGFIRLKRSEFHAERRS